MAGPPCGSGRRQESQPPTRIRAGVSPLVRARRARRLRLALQLTEEGWSQRRIAAHLGLARATIRGYLTAARRAGLDAARAAALPESELLSLVEMTRRCTPPSHQGSEDFTEALWELKADPRATMWTVWQRLRVRERWGESLAEFSHRYRAWLACQHQLLRLPDRAGQRLVTAVIPVAGTRGHGTAVYAAQVGASGLMLLELGEGVGEERWRLFVYHSLIRLMGRPLRAVLPTAVAGRGSAQRVSGEVLGCLIAPPDPPAEQVLLERLEMVRGDAWPADFTVHGAGAEAILRRWEDELNGAPLPGLGQSSRELFERLDRERLRPLHPGSALE